ncbi:hypothetical protein GCM10010971_37280 [Silvimonas amylolytica]|uniref:Uncharacterized protein n=1 Tax=Silvimonas amylolytica TaxID=449663 RepID=A0ABQ2PRL9_9NEIS|nr:hypothetical protein GCM10010971_37280 [Silvimonas amylolytica]
MIFFCRCGMGGNARPGECGKSVRINGEISADGAQGLVEAAVTSYKKKRFPFYFKGLAGFIDPLPKVWAAGTARAGS